MTSSALGMPPGATDMVVGGLSLELRWMRDGSVPLEVVEWFRCVAGARPERRRVDAYWLGGDLGAASIKVRAVVDPRGGRIRARRLEMKVLQRRLGLISPAPHVVGAAELWLKSRRRSPLPEVGQHPSEQTDPVWMMVHKHRVRHRVAGPLPRTSTSLELTRIEAGEFTAWSVAAQARGQVSADSLRPLLDATVHAAFSTWPDSVPLEADASGSYPSWLHRRLLER